MRQVASAATGEMWAFTALAANLLHFIDTVATDMLVQRMVEDIQHIVGVFATADASHVAHADGTIGLDHTQQTQVAAKGIEKHLTAHQAGHHQLELADVGRLCTKRVPTLESAQQESTVRPDTVPPLWGVKAVTVW